jgi:rod shape-determining protein MreD
MMLPPPPRRLSFVDGVPLLTGLGSVVVTHLPLGADWMPPVGPWFTAMVVFYWSLYAPRLMPYGVCLALGLMDDVLSGAPLGMSMLSLVLLRQLAYSQRRFLLNRPFALAWLSFAFSVLVVGAIEVFFLVRLELPTMGMTLLRLALSAFLFPPVYWVLARVQRSAGQVDA